jgi:hypothetical protein
MRSIERLRFENHLESAISQVYKACRQADLAGLENEREVLTDIQHALSLIVTASYRDRPLTSRKTSQIYRLEGVIPF